MRFSILLVVTAFTLIACAFAADPTKPVWPPAFSASVIISRVNVEHPTEEYFRWFYDAPGNRERFDGLFPFLGQVYFRRLIVDYANGVDYTILTRGNTVQCSSRKVSGNLIKPIFGAFNYAGFSLVNYELTNHWVSFNRTINRISNYYESVNDREPVEFDRTNEETGEEEIWSFYEYDIGTQDSDLWIIPEPIKQICANN